MLPTQFPEQTRIIGKPKDWTDEQCMDLPIWKGDIPIDEEGTKVKGFISCWKLAKEDLEEIQKTGVVWLIITSDTLPPASVCVDKPFV